MPTDFTYDVFMSHNSRDKPRVRKLAERLRDAGLRVWFDDWVLRPGDDIYLAIEHGLEAARAKMLRRAMRSRCGWKMSWKSRAWACPRCPRQDPGPRTPASVHGEQSSPCYPVIDA